MSTPASEQRFEYEAPRLRALGSVHELTQGTQVGLLGDGLFTSSGGTVKVS